MRLKLGGFLLLGLGLGTMAQAEISAFPVGVTEMVWSLRGAGPAQELRLEVEGLPEGRYRVTLGLTLEGTESELSLLGFLGAPLLVQSAGAQVDLSALNVLMRRKDMLNVDERYALPGGDFLVQEKREIAGVVCLVGEFRPTERADTVIEVGFSLEEPVYFLPLLRVRERGRLTFEMVLSRYGRP